MKDLRTDRFKLKELFPDKAKKYAQKLHVKADEIGFIRKGIPIDPKDIEIKEGERAAIRLVTTPHLDRDGEILIPHGGILDDFRQSPSVLYAHDYRGLPIGSDQWIKQMKEGILAKTIYAKHQFAEDVYQCVKDKHLNSNSVGFIPVEAVNQEEDKKSFEEWQGILEKDYGITKEESGKAKNIYTKWIMLEHSDVPVASNAQSLNLAVSKGELVIQSDRLKKDLEIEVVKNVEVEVVRDKKFTEKEKVEIEYRVEKGKEAIKELREHGKPVQIITKPETTENYHRIPVESPDKHKGHRIRTITISASQGIKALYCGTCKKVITYLFDVKKWSMQEAQAWVNSHKGQVIFECIDGHIVQSKLEADFDNWLFENQIVHDVQVQVCDERNWTCDFVLINGGGKTRWIEIDGMKESREELGTEGKFREKIKYYEDNDFDFLIITKENVEQKKKEIEKNLEEKINEESDKQELIEEMALEVKEEKKEPVHWTDKGEFKLAIEIVQEQYERLLDTKDEYISELKEGRVLSTKNRTLVKDVIDALTNLKELLEELYNATEPPAKEEEKKTEAEIVVEKNKKEENLAERIGNAFEKLVTSGKLKEMLEQAAEIAIKKKMGKVE